MACRPLATNTDPHDPCMAVRTGRSYKHARDSHATIPQTGCARVCVCVCARARTCAELSGLACRRMEKMLGYVIPVALGEGLFLPYGLLPRRFPLVQVVGKPIAVPKCTSGEDSAEFGKLLEEFHIKYITSLLALYDQHKDTYDKGRTSDIRLVE